MADEIIQLTRRITTELQLILANVDARDHRAACRACARLEARVVELRTEISDLIHEEHRRDRRAVMDEYQEEIDSLKRALPSQCEIKEKLEAQQKEIAEIKELMPWGLVTGQVRSL